MQPGLDSLLIGQAVGDYRIERALGDGNFGFVFEAEPLTSGPRVAIKILKPGAHPTDQIDFANEGILLKKLIPCDGVINHIGEGSHDLLVSSGAMSFPIPLPYQVMALASGSLDEISSDPTARARWDLIDTLQLWRSAVLSLMRMHQHSVAHRDIKCSNALIMLGKSGQMIRFADLGRAKDVTTPISRPTHEYVVGRGDINHAAPEALFWQGEADAEAYFAADYYGLGSMLVEMLTGSSITTLAIGNISSAFHQGQADFTAGRSRDLTSMLVPRYDNAISQVVDILPRAIRGDITHLLKVLCHPDPAMRIQRSPYSRDANSLQRLEWVLRRIDISIRRVKIERRESRRRERSVA